MKKILAIVLSIAMLVMAMPFSVFAAETTVATDTWDGTTSKPTETDAEGNFIVNTAEELAWVALAGQGETTGNSYKVADNQIFDMQGLVGISLDSTAEEVKAAEKTGQYWYDSNMSDASVSFMGDFDGNGLVVYNICGKPGEAYGALFPQLRNVNNTIKNVTVKASAFYGYHYAAGIVANASGNTYDHVIDSCAVENCYFAYSGSGIGTKTLGGILGVSGNYGTTINNCLAVNNLFDTEENVEIYGGIIGNTSSWGNGVSITNTICIGTSPYPIALGTTAIGGKMESATVSNVYSDVECTANGYTTLTTEQMQGAAAVDNMPGLNWYVNWVPGVEGEYPELCLSDYDYWKGSADTEWEQDEEGNYIISTAEELYGMVKSNGMVNETPASFKVADGVKAFYLNDIMSLIKRGVDSETIYDAIKSGNNWNSGNLNGTYAVTAGFQGSFDGNGATIYGLYANNTYNAGFIPIVLNNGQTTTIKNVAFKYSYVECTAGNNIRAGVVVGATGVDSGYKDGNSTTLNFENVRVENAKFVTAITGGYQGQRGGICGESQSSKTNITSCFAADITELDTTETPTGTNQYQSYLACGLIHSVANDSLTVNDSVEINVSEQSVTWKTTITNSYSTMGTGTYIKLDSAEAAKGAVAKDNMPLLDWTNTWFATADGYPELRAFHNISAVDNGDGTHSEACADCDIAGAKDNHIYDAETGKCTVCPAECFHGFDVDEEKGALEFVVTVPGDCTTPDKGVLKCTICGITDPTEIEDPSGAAGHTKGEAVKENENAATCTEAGSYDSVVYCSVCKEEVSRDTITVDALGHTDGEVKEENRVESTCTTQGSCDKVTYCSVCGEVSKTEHITLELDPDAHVYDDDNDTTCNECGEERTLFTYGDVNNDGVVNNKDLGVLMQHLNEWEVDIVLAAADVNVDGAVNNKDYGVIMQYLNDWDVTLGPVAE